MTTSPAASPDPSTGTGAVPPYGQEAAYTTHAPVPAGGAPVPPAAPPVPSTPPAPVLPPPPPVGGAPERPATTDGPWGSPGAAPAPWGSADPATAGHSLQGDAAGQHHGAGQGYGTGQTYGGGQGYGAGQTYGPYPYGSYPAYPAGPVPPRNELAVWSLVLGVAGLLFGCVFFTGVPAIVLGHRARRAVAEGEADNEALATAGIVLGWLATGLGVLVVVLVVLLAVVPLLTLGAIGPLVDSVP